MEGKVCIVTGANQGIGYTTAKELAAKGAHVILACRDVEKGEEARQKIIAATGNTKVEVLELDLSSFESVKNFVAQFEAKNLPLHVLFNNASVFGVPYKKTQDNFESHFQVNYLGLYMLTTLLQHKLIESSPSRVINVSSLLHLAARMNLETITNEKLYIHGILGYARSKLCVTVYSMNLAKRLQNSGVTVNIVDPLFTNTKSYRSSHGIVKFLLKWSQHFLGRSVDKAGADFAWVASDPSLEKVTGKYFINKRSIPIRWTCKNLNSQIKLEKYTEQLMHFNKQL